ncbi:MAG: hypothetical protein K5888_09565 [Lachnospiraceae bacterium]|nr:hypothetical protein [Lachnospiraceae bacterium]
MKKLLPILFILLILLSACGNSDKTDDTSDKEDKQESDSKSSSKERKKADIKYYSFDGSGVEYTVTIDDPEVVTYDQKKKYKSLNHLKETGSGFDMIFRFEGLKKGESIVTISESSPIADSYIDTYRIIVDKKKNITIEQISHEPVYFDPYPMDPVAVLGLALNGEYLSVYPCDNKTVDEMIPILSRGEIEITLEDQDGTEKIGTLPWTVETDDEEIDCSSGDIIISEGNKITLCYTDGDRNGVKFAYITDLNEEELKNLLGDGDATITLFVEYTE